MISVVINDISLDRLSEWANFTNFVDSSEEVDVDNSVFTVTYSADQITMVIAGNYISLINKLGDTFKLNRKEFRVVSMA